eukprot:jgi/Tetstr1/423175/TSEL_013943.t1
MVPAALALSSPGVVAGPHRAPLVRRSARRLPVAPRAAASSTGAGAGSYLSEAAAQIFSSPDVDRGVRWTTTPFTGEIKHHERPPHNRFQPNKTPRGGHKLFQHGDPSVLHRHSEDVAHGEGFMQGMLRALFAGNFSNSDPSTKHEPKSFGGHTGFSHDIARNQREISRLVALTKDDSIKAPW